jgi:hypothetical protein
VSTFAALIAPAWMVPHVTGRLMVLLLCPCSYYDAGGTVTERMTRLPVAVRGRLLAVSYYQTT